MRGFKQKYFPFYVLINCKLISPRLIQYIWNQIWCQTSKNKNCPIYVFTVKTSVWIDFPCSNMGVPTSWIFLKWQDAIMFFLKTIKFNKKNQPSLKRLLIVTLWLFKTTKMVTWGIMNIFARNFKYFLFFIFKFWKNLQTNELPHKNNFKIVSEDVQPYLFGDFAYSL